jgi:hypothetical protein
VLDWSIQIQPRPEHRSPESRLVTISKAGKYVFLEADNMSHAIDMIWSWLEREEAHGSE